MLSKRTICAVMSLAPALLGCAAPGLLPDTSNTTLTPKMANGGRYVLSAHERKLPCSRLRGRIQLRVLEIRDRATKRQPTLVSRAIRSTANSIPGWHRKTPALGGRYDLAVLTAYNNRLGQLGCATYDIATELSPGERDKWQIR